MPGLVSHGPEILPHGTRSHMLLAPPHGLFQAFKQPGLAHCFSVQLCAHIFSLGVAVLRITLVCCSPTFIPTRLSRSPSGSTFESWGHPGCRLLGQRRVLFPSRESCCHACLAWGLPCLPRDRLLSTSLTAAEVSLLL